MSRPSCNLANSQLTKLCTEDVILFFPGIFVVNILQSMTVKKPEASAESLLDAADSFGDRKISLAHDDYGFTSASKFVIHVHAKVFGYFSLIGDSCKKFLSEERSFTEKLRVPSLNGTKENFRLPFLSPNDWMHTHIRACVLHTKLTLICHRYLSPHFEVIFLLIIFNILPPAWPQEDGKMTLASLSHAQYFRGERVGQGSWQEREATKNLKPKAWPKTDVLQKKKREKESLNPRRQKTKYLRTASQYARKIWRRLRRRSWTGGQRFPKTTNKTETGACLPVC